MSDCLDKKNGVRFEAASEALYIAKIEELIAERDALKQEVAGGSWAFVKQIDELNHTVKVLKSILLRTQTHLDGSDESNFLYIEINETLYPPEDTWSKDACEK